MSFDQIRKQNNLKQMQAAAKYLSKKGYDLNNLPKVQHNHAPILTQRQSAIAKLAETEQEDDDSEDNFLMMQYLKDKRNRVNNQRELQSHSNINRSNFIDNKKQNTSRVIDWSKYEYYEDDAKGREDQQRQRSWKKQDRSRVLQKAPSRLNYREQISKQNYTIITEQYKKDKVKVEDVFAKHEPLRINYKKADVNEWENHKKNEDFRLEYVLRKLPNIKKFKNNQKAIIKCALENTNIFVCMPTGGGKSLTFQVLTFLSKGIYICVMPLISLIFDQQMQAKKMGIEAYSMTANTSQSEVKLIYQKLSNFRQSQDSIVIFCTPEKLNLSLHFSDILESIYQRGELKRIVIDEVHCVSSWGKDFRIEYENLSTLKKRFPKTPILALTATVTEVVKQDIISKLGIEGCFFFQSSFNRPNLYYEVRSKDKNILEQIQKIIQRYKNKAGLIYCMSRKECEETCFKLIKKGYKTAYYHADIQEQEKKRIQERWMNNQTNIIVATIAFGMGINKPDVRFVIHHTMSKSLENYYQESGRAGRDGEFSECIIFYRKQDKQFLQSMNLKNQFSTLARKEFTTKQLAEMIKYCENRSTCRRKFQLDYLGQTDFDPKICNKTCDNCKNSQIFKEYECIVQGKELVKTLLQLQNKNVSLSRNQLIDLIRGKGEKTLKNKMSQIQRMSIDLKNLKTTFMGWKSNELESLIVDFMSYEILQQRVFKSLIMRNNKKNEVVNVYIKCDVPKCRVFLNRVQTLPFRRTLQREAVKGQTNNVFSSYQDEFQFEDELKGEMSSNNSLSEDNQTKFMVLEAEQTNKFELYQQLLQQIYEGEDDSPS